MDHPKAIKDAVKNAEQAVADRDRTVRDAHHKGGMSIRAIAAAAGKSHGWAHKILQRGKS